VSALEIGSFTAFASLVIAGRRLAAVRGVDRASVLAEISSGAKSLDAALGTTGLAGIAADMAREAEAHALHFTHPGRARDDAIALFWQVAPAAFADPAVFDPADPDPARTAGRMVAAIRAGPLGRDFREAVLAEPFFFAVALGSLERDPG
jgi:hypothetical protein